jgi:AraC-like DNA-binding protein
VSHIRYMRRGPSILKSFGTIAAASMGKRAPIVPGEPVATCKISSRRLSRPRAAAGQLQRDAESQPPRLRAIMTDICAHLGDDELSVVEVAQRQRVTPRYVHKLFENEGLTFSSLCWADASRAHRMLSDPQLADRTIGFVAFDVGFDDLSYFNRTCRRRYGAAPTEIRQLCGAAIGAGGGNRTRIYSLGSCRSTTELRPRSQEDQ